MTTSSPPSKVISEWATPHRAQPGGVPLSLALDFIDTLSEQGIVLAMVMPEPEAITEAANKAGITPQQAIDAYLTILSHG